MVVKLQQVNEDDLYDQFPEMKRADIDAFRQWAGMQPHFPPVTELHLIAAYVSCSYKMEAAKRCLDNLLTIRTHAPELFLNRSMSDPDIQLALKSYCLAVMPNCTPEGHVVGYLKLLDTNPDVWNFNAGIKLMTMVVSLFMHEHGPIAGYHIIFDVKGSSLKHLLKTSVMSVKKALIFLQEAFPVPIIGCHVVNAVPWMDKIIDFARPFVLPDLMKLLHIHGGDNATLLNFLPKHVLPTDIGGTCCPAIDCHYEFVRKCHENSELFLREDLLLVDESKRPSKSYVSDDSMLGVQGSFKKIEFD